MSNLSGHKIQEGSHQDFFFVQKIVFGQHKSNIIFIFFIEQSAIFFLEFNIRLYDKNSESDYFFFLYQNQNIFFSNIANQNIFFRKKNIPPSPWKLNGPSLTIDYSSFQHIIVNYREFPFVRLQFHIFFKHNSKR